MNLILDADFSQNGKPNPKDFSYDLGDFGWGNNELENYTDKEENAYIKDNTLIIKALKTDYGYSSARLTTYKKHSFKYGSFRIVAKAPSEVGTWPAIWLLPNSIKEGTRWPRCGEIDIFEHVGTEPGRVHFSLHSFNNNFRKGNQRVRIVEGIDAINDFHEYRLDWTYDKIVFFYDSKEVITFKAPKEKEIDDWPFDQEFYLIINLAIGGSWPGNPKEDFTEAEFLIKSIKIYEI